MAINRRLSGSRSQIGPVLLSSRRRHTRSIGDWSSDVCSSDLGRIVIDRRGQPTVPTPRAPRCQRCTPATQGSMVSRTVVTEELLLLLPGCSPTKGVLAGHHIRAHRDATPAAVRASISYASGMPFGAAHRATRRHGGCGTDLSPCRDVGGGCPQPISRATSKRGCL